MNSLIVIRKKIRMNLHTYHTHTYIYIRIYICICVIIFAYIVHILWMEDILHQPVGGLSQIRVLTVFHMFHNYCIVTNWCRDLSIHTAWGQRLHPGGGSPGAAEGLSAGALSGDGSGDRVLCPAVAGGHWSLGPVDGDVGGGWSLGGL